MSSGELLSQPRKKILCECGNVIEYVDIQHNCDFPQYQTLACSECSERHRIVLDGTLDELVGAKISKF